MRERFFFMVNYFISRIWPQNRIFSGFYTRKNRTKNSQFFFQKTTRSEGNTSDDFCSLYFVWRV